MGNKGFKLHLLAGLAATIVLILTACKHSPPGPPDQDQLAYDAADGLTGGRLYDHFISEINITDPDIKGKPNFFRCKSCHGWDLFGREGHLINMAPTASYPAVSVSNLQTYAASHSIKEIFNAVKNKGGRAPSAPCDATMPDYSSLLTDARIWQIVKFMKKEASPVSDFYDQAITGTYPTGSIAFSNIGKDGDAIAGRVFYTAQCKSCHGIDGSMIDIYCKGDWLGNVFRDDPFELQHKSKFGMPMDIDHPGCTAAGSMAAIPAITPKNIRDLLKMGQDTFAFPSFK